MGLKNTGKLIGAVSLIVVGMIFLLKEFGYINTDVGKFWPLILVVIGIVMIFEYSEERRSPKSGDWF